MTPHLLDGSVVIALSSRGHPHYQRSQAWLSSVASVAVCPISEGALVRFAVRMGADPHSAQETLRAVKSRPGVEFWANDLSYTDADLSQVRGHRQVTDAYLVGLAARRGGVVATLDRGLAQAHPDHTLLLPSA